MSFLVLHMDKFKKESVRGIQSHNRRERESHSNPDIDYDRSPANYELHENAATNYAQAIQNRIDDLLLVKAVRKDAVHMCGLIVSSDRAFFDTLTPEETHRFFEEARAFLTDFVGKENVLSAMVHMDEKTPHMHFLHVPVTPDGRLSANSIYTRASLKKLQDELPRHLQSRGFNIERGVEQKKGSAKKHLDTLEFKQQREAVAALQKESEAMKRRLGEVRAQESRLRESIAEYEREAEEAEKILQATPQLPQVSLFNYKSVMKEAAFIIKQQQKSLANKSQIARQRDTLVIENGRLKRQAQEQNERLARMDSLHSEERQKHTQEIRALARKQKAIANRLDEYSRFTAAQGLAESFRDWQAKEREEAARQEAERQAERERQIQQEREAEPRQRRSRMR